MRVMMRQYPIARLLCWMVTKTSMTLCPGFTASKYSHGQSKSTNAILGELEILGKNWLQNQNQLDEICQKVVLRSFSHDKRGSAKFFIILNSLSATLRCYIQLDLEYSYWGSAQFIFWITRLWLKWSPGHFFDTFWAKFMLDLSIFT